MADRQKKQFAISIAMIPPMSAGIIKNRMGLTPRLSRASISVFTFMLAMRVVKELPLRPAIKKAVKMGPSSRTMAITIKLPKKLPKPTFGIKLAVFTINTVPKIVPTTSINGKDFMPML